MITLGVSQARQSLPKLIEEVDSHFERLTITKGGRAKAVLMSADEFESWIETLASYQDRETMKIHDEIKSAKSIKEIKNLITLKEMGRRVGIK